MVDNNSIINIIGYNTPLQDLYKRYFLSKKNIKLKFLEFDDMLKKTRRIIEKKEKIIVDISRLSNYIQEITVLEKIFFDHSKLLILLVNENQEAELKDNAFLSDKTLNPHNLQQITKKLIL